MPTESSLQALEGEGDFMQGFFATVSTLVQSFVGYLSMEIGNRKRLGL